MAKVINTVATLSALKKELGQRNITQFHSIGDIKEFERTYLQQLRDAEDETRGKLKADLESISVELNELTSIVSSKRAKAEEEITERISQLNERIKSLEGPEERVFHRFVARILISSIRRKIRVIERKRTLYIEKTTKQAKIAEYHLKERFQEFSTNFEEILSRDVWIQVQRIKDIKASIEELRPIIVGSIGESMVSATLSALPDTYVVINNVHMKLFEPIFYLAENDRIFSFQIDHVVVGPSGVFAIETKHWGQEAIANRDLFSPVKQVRRSGYALFRQINNGLISLDAHWGDRAVSVRNIIVFTASSVKEQYQHVKLLHLASLNNYIQWFDEEFAASDVDRIVSFLLARCIRETDAT